jgi:sugar phosphate isomerase/epimerase
MAAIEICTGGNLDQPAPEIARRVLDAALGEGLILLTCGPNSNVLRFLFPLTISDETFAEGLQRLKRALLAAGLLRLSATARCATAHVCGRASPSSFHRLTPVSIPKRSSAAPTV